jgi:hypothetical protein
MNSHEGEVAQVTNVTNGAKALETSSEAASELPAPRGSPPNMAQGNSLMSQEVSQFWLSAPAMSAARRPSSGYWPGGWGQR